MNNIDETLANEKLTELYSFDGDKFSFNNQSEFDIFGTLDNSDDPLLNSDIQDQI